LKKLWITIMLLGLITAQLSGCTENVSPVETEISQTTTESEIDSVSTTVPETENTPSPYLENFREVLGDNDFCAVAHLGYLDGSYYEIMSHVEDLGMLEEFPFLEIPKENYLPLAGGELYAVIPADDDAAITVYTGVMDETDFTVKADKKLAEFTGGEPVLLKCNVSEIMPNVVFEITANGVMHTYSPSLSGENGQLVETAGVYDFSPYDVLLAGIADGADYVFCDKWLTTEPDRAGDPMVLCLNLMPDGTAEYACGPANSEFIDAFVGTWSLDVQSDVIRLLLGAGQLECEFSWELDGYYLKLTHLRGDELLEGSAGGTFRFMNEYDFHNIPKG